MYRADVTGGLDRAWCFWYSGPIPQTVGAGMAGVIPKKGPIEGDGFSTGFSGRKGRPSKASTGVKVASKQSVETQILFFIAKR